MGAIARLGLVIVARRPVVAVLPRRLAVRVPRLRKRAIARRLAAVGALSWRLRRTGARAIAGTIAGGVGGAVAGNAIQRNSNTQGGYDTYRVSVQTENGAFRSYDLASANDFRPGDRVRIQNGQLYRN